MWALDNKTSFGAERNWIRDRDGRHHWVVAIRAEFEVTRTGELRTADVQAPPVLAPEYQGEPGLSSMRLDSDLLANKPCTDVLLDAWAYAPHGRRATNVPVSFRVGNIAKVVHVHGDRVYYKAAIGGLTVSSAAPFERRPIRYEQAYGGSDTTARDPSRHGFDARNPIGVGFAVDPDDLVDRPAPSVVYPNTDLAKAGPAGFGPIDRAWSPRRELAGTYDERWARTKRPLLPNDYDELFASSVPADQRALGHLKGGELVEVTNACSDGRIRFALPRLNFLCETFFGSRRVQHPTRLTSVILEPERRSVSLVWQSSLFVAPCDDDYLDQTKITEAPYSG